LFLQFGGKCKVPEISLFLKNTGIMNHALFLDRDGIINVDHGYTFRPADFLFREGIFDLCQAAMAKGYRLIVVTNQSGISRGYYGHEEVAALHRYMADQFQERQILLDAIYYCPHHPEFSGKCLCRKPGSLMLEKGIARCQLDPGKSFMIGDSRRDIAAGKAVGCQTIGVGPETMGADWQVQHLLEIIAWL
jgi:D-glycero-D-manno-heptose 1,7-bisphosphate phosphatase